MAQGWTPVAEQSAGWTPVPETPLSTPRDERGMPRVTSYTTDSEKPSDLLSMLGPLAHPETLTDFARILTLPVDSVRRALAATLTMAAAKPAATATMQAVKSVPAAAGRAVINTAAAAGDVVDPSVIGMASPRVGKAVQFAQKVRDARAAAAAARSSAPPVVAPVVAEAPVVAAPVASTAVPQKVLNELAIAARRSQVVLTPETEQAAIEAVRRGATPMEAVATVRGAAGPAAETLPGAPAPRAVPAPVAEAPSAASLNPNRLKLAASEVKEYKRLRVAGKTHQEAATLIEAQRELAQRLGLPSSETLRTAVADRNVSGRWRE
jgi:hypothetical protein